MKSGSEASEPRVYYEAAGLIGKLSTESAQVAAEWWEAGRTVWVCVAWRGDTYRLKVPPDGLITIQGKPSNVLARRTNPRAGWHEPTMAWLGRLAAHLLVAATLFRYCLFIPLQDARRLLFDRSKEG